MKQYRVLSGEHTGLGGVKYKQGDIIPSNKDLIKTFPNKFELVTAVVEIPAASIPPPPPAREIPPPAAQPKPAKAQAAVLSESGVQSPPPAPEAPAASPFGEDVTEDYPTASAAELKVFRKGSAFHVVDPDLPGKALNPSGLKVNEVNKFIKKHLKQ